jgi:hypothetical protein
MSDPDPDLENPFVQSLMFTELFRTLEMCDSTRVDDFWEVLDETVLEVLNLKGRKVDHG